MTDPFSNPAIHSDYAIRTQSFEQFRRQWHVPLDQRVFTSPTVIDIYPKQEAFSLLTGLSDQKPFVSLTIPQSFFDIRFFSSQLVPSLGSNENIEAKISNIQAALDQTVERKEEKEEEGLTYIVMLDFCKKVNEENQIIRNKMAEYIQG